MEYESITNKYCVKKLSIDDCDDILTIYKNNLDYFKYCLLNPSIKTVKEDLSSLPDGVDISGKYYLGFFDNNSLIAVIDLVFNYPDEHTCFIGLFMIDDKFQGKGIGSSLIEDICAFLKTNNYKYVKLAYILDNVEAKNFWEKNKFVSLKKTISNEQLEVGLCVREL